MAAKRGLKEIERRVWLILPQSFTNIQFLKWIPDSDGASASLRLEAVNDNCVLVFSDYKGSALVNLNGEAFWSLDGYHKSVRIEKGAHLVEVEFTPYTAFGDRTTIAFGTPILAVCDPVAYRLWIHCSTILDFAKQTKDQEVSSDLFDVLTTALEQSPFESVTHEQILLATRLQEKFPKELLNTIPESSPTAEDLGYRETRVRPEWSNAMTHLEGRLQRLVEKYGKRGELVGVAHGHIDTAWLWPFSETEKKVARTFSVVATLMDRMSEFHYVQSMAVYYDWMRTSQPRLYERIKRYVKEGRWELGAGWVENDANLPSGESFARQLLYSQQFYQNEFGRLARVYWLPDSFGFAASLPQIAKLGGIKLFATHKLYWNDTNTFPYALFNWMGIDGTVLASIYFGQGRDGYNSTFAVEEIIEQWSNWADKDLELPMLYAFGYGDGGGGPTEDMFLRAEAVNRLPILPRVRLTGDGGHGESFIGQNYSKLVAGEISKNIWRGELYVETHRGVQTSHTRMKQLNRRAECALREAEVWSTIAWSILGESSDAQGLVQEVQSLWKTLLKHQFHDVLPGSSINEVYSTAYRELEETIASAERIATDSMKRLAGPGPSSQQSKPSVLFNSLPWRRTGEYVVVPNWINGAQQVEDGYLAKVNVPSVGMTILEEADSQRTPEENVLVRDDSDSYFVENQFFNIKLDKNNGLVESIFDKEAGREVLRSRSNRFIFYENVPGWADAWDIEKGYKNTSFEVSRAYLCEVLENGPLRARIRLRKRFRHSTIEQEILVHAGSRRIDFKTTTNLHDRELLLKVWFDFDINTDTAVFDIPFGNIERKTTFNTSWERAKFEVPMQKWADASESDYGVALLNDGRYGIAVENSSFGLSIAKTPIYPDSATDSEESTFTFSVYPHKGGWREAGIPQRAYELNVPIRLIRAEMPETHSKSSFVSLDSNNIMMEGLKIAEDQSAVVFRLYEMYNKRGTLQIGLWGQPQH
ncbi:alpha-mannosidase, partial [Candidatus Bathyarchaeota archaeon]|nr:alpha-mannosidase [Candidatus Bathyarchaeota archaeon]